MSTIRATQKLQNKTTETQKHSTILLRLKILFLSHFQILMYSHKEKYKAAIPIVLLGK